MVVVKVEVKSFEKRKRNCRKIREDGKVGDGIRKER